MKLTYSAIALALATIAAPVQADYSLTILHINDLHSRIQSINKYNSTCSAEAEQEQKCFGGFARVKAMLDERRAALDAAGKAYIVIDAGDQFQGSLFYTTFKGAVAAELMNDTGFDVMAVGNHEFDDGPEKLIEFVDTLDAPMISSNIDVSAIDALAGKVLPSLVLERGGEKIGIVSALAEDTPETSSPGEQVIFANAESALAESVKALQAQGVDKIIAVNHEGLARDIEIAKSVTGLDAIVGGHSHTLLSNQYADSAQGPYPMMVENPDGINVPVVQAFAYSKYVGELELTWNDEGTLTSAVGDTILLDSSVVPDATMQARIAELGAPLEEIKAQVIGAAAEVVDGQRENCRAKECQMGNLVAEAMLDRVRDQGVRIAIQNGGGLRASIAQGEVTMGSVLTVLPFQNTLATFDLTGAQVIAALENGVSQVEEVKGRFPQVAGIRYTWTRSVDANAGRILSVKIAEGDDWQAIDPEQVYSVVSNDYMRSGGDGYSVFRDEAQNAYDFGPNLETVVADYIMKHSPYSPLMDGRIVEK